MLGKFSDIKKTTLGLFLASAACFGCTTDQIVRNEVSDSALYQTTLSGSEEPGPLEVAEAYFDGRRLYVRYQPGQRCCYIPRSRTEPYDLSESMIEDDALAGPAFLSREKAGEDPWKGMPEDQPAAHVFSRKAWREYLRELFLKIIPAEPGQGSLVDFSHREYFLFYGEDGQPRAVLIEDKPGDVRIGESWDLDDVLNAGFPLLEKFLDERNVSERQIIFNTGDSGLYSYPFVFIDLYERKVLFAQTNAPATIASRLFSGKDIQSTSHFVGSHAAIVVRPISALGRLFYGLYDTSLDLVESGGDLGEQVFLSPFISSGRNSDVTPLSESPGMDLGEWENWLDGFTVEGSSSGTMEFHIDGEEFFPRFIDAITMARESVHIRTYIFDNDDYAIKIADILKERSTEVEVKVLMDGLGTILATKAHPDDLPLHHETPQSVSRYLEDGSKVKARLQTNPWMSLDHSKLMVLDGQTAFIGGMNIGREYRYHRHDLMAELHGPVVDILQKEFHKAWAHAGVLGDLGYLLQSIRHPKKNRESSGYPVRVLFSRAAEPDIYTAQLEAIRRAKRYVYIENMYLIQDTILKELVKARRRGVDVRVIIPLAGHMGPFDRANIVGANLLLEKGVRVYFYPGQLHTKAAIYDGWACFGSANMDKASFKRNRELNIATSHPEAVEDLMSRLFLPDFEVSREMVERIPQHWSDGLAEMLTDQL